MVEVVSSKTDEKMQEKKAAWDKEAEKVGEITDSNGQGVDEGIRETVVAFSVNGLNTRQSCEGHNIETRSTLTPWVEVTAPNRPKTQFIGESEIFQRFADKYNIPLAQFRRGENMDAWWEATRESQTQDETPEYTAWREKSDALVKKASELLEEFYAKRESDPTVRLHMTQISDGVGRVWSGEDEENFSKEKTAPEDERPVLLLKRQVEMAAFTEVLRNRYFSS